MNVLLLVGITRIELLTFTMVVLAVFLGLFVIFCLGVWISQIKDSCSPYSGFPLRRASGLNWTASEKVLRFLFDLHEYDNRFFDLQRASFCRETGRLFPETMTWYDKIKLDWSFLQKRYPGHYVSWGSLSEDQQRLVRSRHSTLEGFQTEFSSPSSSPRAIESEYAFAKPGPLYVDIDTNVLVGWKEVPGTELEVLVVQKPKTDYDLLVKFPEEKKEKADD